MSLEQFGYLADVVGVATRSWIWVIWGVASASSIVFVAFDYFDQTMLSHMALNLIPLLALAGACLGVIALAGGWQRSKPRGTRP